jgi:hypothetical protein
VSLLAACRNGLDLPEDHGATTGACATLDEHDCKIVCDLSNVD